MNPPDATVEKIAMAAIDNLHELSYGQRKRFKDKMLAWVAEAVVQGACRRREAARPVHDIGCRCWPHVSAPAVGYIDRVLSDTEPGA